MNADDLFRSAYAMEHGIDRGRNVREAVRCYERLVTEFKHSEAMHRLALLLSSDTDGVKQDRARASRLFENAIEESSHVRAMYSLACLLVDRCEGVDRNPERALQLLNRAVEEGSDVLSMYKLAVLFANGCEGIEKNAFRAVHFYERAIELGAHVPSMHDLGVILMNGCKGVRRNLQSAACLFEIVIEKTEDADAMNYLGAILCLGAKGVDKDPQRAFRLWQRAIVSAAHVPSMRNLGALLSCGAEGVEKDVQQAVRLYERAIEEGSDTPSMNSLAVLLTKGCEDVEKDPSRAVHLWQRAIDGDAYVPSMINLGCLLNCGAEGVEKDIQHARRLYERAIEEVSDVGSMDRLGVLLLNGDDGIRRDEPRAVELFERAIHQGSYVPSMRNLGSLLSIGSECVEKDVKRAMVLYERAIEEGADVPSMNNLALLLWNGSEDTGKDPERALKLLEHAIDLRAYVPSMRNLGFLCSVGAKGITKDVQKAVSLYERAIAEGSDVCSMDNLALLLTNNIEDVDKDPERAYYLWQRAIVSAAHVPSMRNLGFLLSCGAEGVEKDVQRAVRLYERAIEEGSDVPSMNNLAVLLTSDCEGVEKDPPRAVSLLERAIVDAAYVPSMRNLGSLLASEAEGIEKDVQRAVRLYERAIAEGSDVASMDKLGVLLLCGKDGVGKDEQGALGLFERAINEGSYVPSMRNLGALLICGAQDVKKDVQRAVRLFERAIEEGSDAPSMNNLAVLLTNGCEGVSQDPRRAMRLWQRAIDDAGHVPSMRNSASLLSCEAEGVVKDVQRAVRVYECAIEKGSDVASMDKLGVLLLNGDDGIRRDEPRAVALFERAIHQGSYVPSMRNLGSLLSNGSECVEKDVKRAMVLYERAIDEGSDVSSMHKLAVLLLSDCEGVEKDAKRAAQLLTRAVKESECMQSMSAISDLLLRTNCDVDPSVYIRLSRKLLSQKTSKYRNAIQAKALLETVHEHSLHESTVRELAKLLSTGGEGVAIDTERAHRLQLLAENVSYVDSYSHSGKFIETTLKTELGTCANETTLRHMTLKSRQCLMLVLGGAGRGKTSVVRSLKGLEFVENHIATEFLSLSRMKMIPGRQALTDQELEYLAFRQESLTAAASRFEELQGKVAPQSFNPAFIAKSVLEDFRIKGHENALGIESTSSSFERQIPRQPCLSDQYRELVLQKVLWGRLGGPIPKGEDGPIMQCWDLGGQSEYVMAHSLVAGFAQILVFVVDLEKLSQEMKHHPHFDNASGPCGEVLELAKWIQLTHTLSNDPQSVRRIIVGTRKACCENLDEIWEHLRDDLVDALGDASYNSWIRDGPHCAGALQLAAIENSAAIGDPVGSGLQNLEKILKLAGDKIIASRKGIPGRWIALVEVLEKKAKVENIVLWTSKELGQLALKFPEFAFAEDIREADVRKCMQYYRGLGRILMFEDFDNQFLVALNPEKLFDFIRRVTGPEMVLRRRLTRENAKLLKEGLLTHSGVAELWEGHSIEVGKRVLDILCEFDLLMRITRYRNGENEKSLIGIPALLPRTWENVRWPLEKGQVELRIVTRFRDVLPPGLKGRFIAHLHRTVGKEQTPLELIWANGAILQVNDASRVALGFYAARREILWFVRSVEPVQIAYTCLQALREFLSMPCRGIHISYDHSIISDCRACQDSSGKTRSVEFKIPEEWLRNGGHKALANVSGKCSCLKKRSLENVLSEGASSRLESSLSMPYDVFISHADPEKEKIAIPLQNMLESQGVNCFLDVKSLTGSQETLSEQVLGAIRGSRIAVFILSAEFAARHWPMLELREFLNRHKAAKESGRSEDCPIIIPLFYGLTVQDCVNKELPTSDKYHDVFKSHNFFSHDRQRECSLPETMAALKQITAFRGIRNDRNLRDQKFVEYAFSQLMITLQRKNFVDELSQSTKTVSEVQRRETKKKID